MICYNCNEETNKKIMDKPLTLDWIITTLKMSGVNSKKLVVDRLEKMNVNEMFDLEVSIFDKRNEVLRNRGKCPINELMKERKGNEENE